MTQDEMIIIMHERICALLEECKRNGGKSYRKIEKKMGYSAGSLKDIKNNKKMLKTGTVVRFANYFGVRVDWILGRCGDYGKYMKPGRITEPGTERFEASERLVEKLTANEMTMAELSRKIGVSKWCIQSAVQGYTIAKPCTQARIADYFGVTVDWLLGMEEDE